MIYKYRKEYKREIGRPFKVCLEKYLKTILLYKRSGKIYIVDPILREKRGESRI